MQTIPITDYQNTIPVSSDPIGLSAGFSSGDKLPLIDRFYSLLFDGLNDRASIANDNSYQGLAAGTIEMFFLTSYRDAYQKLFQKASVYDIGITQDFGGGAKLFAEIYNVKNFGELTGDIADGVWHHFAMGWDGSDVEAWFDGSRVGADVGGTSNTDTSVGNMGWNGTTEFFNGKMAFFRISTIKRYSGESITIPSKALVVDENTACLPDYSLGTGLTVTDLSGNENDIVLDETNPPTWSEDLPF